MSTNNVLSIIGASCVAFGGQALAQSATASLIASQTTASPGDTVSFTLRVAFDDGGAPAGQFGAPGLFGFGGSVSASGAAAGALAVDAVRIDTQLPFGATQTTGTAPQLVTAAAGSGIGAALVGPQADVVTFDAVVDGSAAGSIELSYQGSVVLVIGDDLLTLSTSPGVNQGLLSVTGATLQVGTARLCADQNADGAITPADFNAWVLNFNAENTLADVNGDGLISPADFNAWILAFGQGSSGPTCSG